MNTFAPGPHAACAAGKTFVLIRAGDGTGANPFKCPVYMGAFPHQAFSSGSYMERLEYGCIKDIRGLARGLPPAITRIEVFGFPKPIAAEVKRAFDSRFSRKRHGDPIQGIAVLIDGIMGDRAQGAAGASLG